jgi:hypothetical protein
MSLSCFSNGPLDFFYAAHSQMASTVLNMTFSLTDPFTLRLARIRWMVWLVVCFCFIS